MIGCDNEKFSIGWFHIKISLVEIGIVQTVGRTCKRSCSSGDRVNIYRASCICMCITSAQYKVTVSCIVKPWPPF